MDLHEKARRLRDLVEPIAAGVYFAPEATERYGELGLGYVEGYFCSRSACLGRPPGRVVAAAFGAFSPQVAERAVAGGWAKTTPEAMLDARLAGATAQLERLLAGTDRQAVARATEILRSTTDGIDPSGRALFAGLSALPWPDEPLGALWRAADLVREHRGDGHIAAWIGRLTSIEVTLLTEPYWGVPHRSYVFTRGWSAEEVEAAWAGLLDRGLVTPEGGLTTDGRDLREQIERDTDLAAREPVDRLGARAGELFALLEGWSAAIIGGGGYPVDPSRLRRPR